MLEQRRGRLMPVWAAAMAVALPATAGDLNAAEDAAEVFIYAEEAGNQALIEHLSTPEKLEQMRGTAARSGVSTRENIRVENVEITDVDGDRATARAVYREKHKPGTTAKQVHLIRVDGEWKVTTAPEDRGE